MKGNIAGIVMVLCFAGMAVSAQQKLDPGGMNYIISTKPNNIIYRDTLYKGSAQFMRLFYRTHDQELIGLYRNHQTNKIAGQVLSIAGTLVTIFGAGIVASSSTARGNGWVFVGTGFAATLAGGYLTFMGQRELETAVDLFNQRYHRTSLGIGFSGNQAGLVYKF